MSTPTVAGQAPSQSDLQDGLERVENAGITAPLGYTSNALHVGLKRKKRDLSLLLSQKPACAAAVFTTNIVKAAPIVWSHQVLSSGKPIRAVVVNSGNANACTGPTGLVHTRQMAEATAAALNCKPTEVIVSSTGVIGVPMPIDTVLSGIPQVAAGMERSPEKALHTAEGIMTTDLTVKQTAVKLTLGGKTVTLGAMAKGSGMIHPNMATMLAFITTDASISPAVLQVALRESVDETYHMISVDGDTSTNDMVMIMANGEAGNPTIDNRNHPDYAKFRAALAAVNQELAEAIAKDGEGATKFLTAHLINAGSKSHARALSKAIVSSSLVKSAFYGADANWGRIISAMGATGIPFEPEKVSLSLISAAGKLLMLDHGVPVAFEEEVAKKILGERDIEILVDLHAGASTSKAWGCDLTHDYVTINSSYRS